MYSDGVDQSQRNKAEEQEEYMAFIKRTTTSEYVESTDDVLESVAVKGLLFVDELDLEMLSPDEQEIAIIQYPESPEPVL